MTNRYLEKVSSEEIKAKSGLADRISGSIIGGVAGFKGMDKLVSHKAGILPMAARVAGTYTGINAGTAAGQKVHDAHSKAVSPPVEKKASQNIYIEKIAVEVQHYKNHTTDKKLAKRNTALNLAGGMVLGPLGGPVNAVDHYTNGRDTTGALREFGRGSITSVGHTIVGAAAGGSLGAGVGAGIGALVRGRAGAKMGATIGSGIGGIGAAIAGGIHGQYTGRLKSIRNQIDEGRLKNVTKTASQNIYIEKIAGMSSTLMKRVGIGATMGATVGAASAGQDNRMKGALGGAALGAVAGGALGRGAAKSGKLASPSVPMSNPELVDKLGNVINAPKLKA